MTDTACAAQVDDVLKGLEERYPTEKDFLQAVGEVVPSLIPVFNRHPSFPKQESWIESSSPIERSSSA